MFLWILGDKNHEYLEVGTLAFDVRLVFLPPVGRKAPGHLTGLSFPVSVRHLETVKSNHEASFFYELSSLNMSHPEVEELTSAQSGAILLTKMLQYGEHLPKNVHVKSVQNLQKDIKDGVKGDKALLEVTYSEEVELPKVFFVKSPGFKSWVRFLEYLEDHPS